MKPCWPEGDLRGYLDGELPVESRQAIAAHLEACAACGASCREMSARAARVSSLMGMLSETPVPRVVRIAPAPVRLGRRWAVAALALAAGLAIGFVVTTSKRSAPPVRIATVPPSVVEAPVEQSAPVVTQAVAPRRRVRHRTPRPTIMQADFMRLDDEPLETGTVVRVSAENGDVQAELIVGPDGRAHAIRMVSNR